MSVAKQTGYPASTKIAAGLCLLLLAMVLAAFALAFLLEATPSYEPFESLENMLSEPVLGLLFATVGGLIAIKRTGNLIGWVLLIAALGITTFRLTQSYGELALLARPDEGFPGGMVAVSLGGGSWTALVTGIFLLLLLFPNGALPSRRWRYVARAVPVCMAVTWLITIFYPDPDPPFQDFENPFAFTDNADYLAIMFPLIIFSLTFMLVAGVDLIVRFWRSKGDEREQFKWLAFAAALFVVTFPLQDVNPALETIGGLAFLALPVSVGFAVLRYRLYDIDILINRTLVYVPLTAIVIGLYTAMVGIFKTLVTEVTETNTDAAVALTTLIIVAVLTPLKNQLQIIVDRYFKERHDPAADVRRLAGQARSVLQVIDTDEFVHHFLADVTASLKAQGSAIELKNGSRPQLISAGDWNGTAAFTAPLRRNGHDLGSLAIGPRLDGRPYETAEQEALQEGADILAHALSLTERR